MSCHVRTMVQSRLAFALASLVLPLQVAYLVGAAAGPFVPLNPSALPFRGQLHELAGMAALTGWLAGAYCGFYRGSRRARREFLLVLFVVLSCHALPGVSGLPLKAGMALVLQAMIWIGMQFGYRAGLPPRP